MQVWMTPRAACRPRRHQLNHPQKAAILVRQALAVTGMDGADEEALRGTLKRDHIIRLRTSLPHMMRR